MWRIYQHENSPEAYPSGCNRLVELLLHKQIYRGQSERLQIWIQTNPAASDNFRQHSLWQVTFITCTVIKGQHGERELRKWVLSLCPHYMKAHILSSCDSHPFWAVQVQRYLVNRAMVSEVSYSLVRWVTVSEVSYGEWSELRWSEVSYGEVKWSEVSYGEWSGLRWSEVSYGEWSELWWSEVSYGEVKWVTVKWSELLLMKWVTLSEVSYGEVLYDKSAMYIRVTLNWG